MLSKLNNKLYFIHGNGQDSTCTPDGFISHDLPGHGTSEWDNKKYNIADMVDFFTRKIPEDSLVFSHSLGGHIALNLGLIRKDLKIVSFGMAPIQKVNDFGSLVLTPNEFIHFQNENRTIKDIENFVNLNQPIENEVRDKLIRVAMRQDPGFNNYFFSRGLIDYDWGEVEKIKSMNGRFKLLLSKNEKVYDYNIAKKINIPLEFDDYVGHSPWLSNDSWIQKILLSISFP